MAARLGLRRRFALQRPRFTHPKATQHQQGQILCPDMNVQPLDYDADGNVLGTGSRTYTWDDDGDLTNFDGNESVNYDALGRPVAETFSNGDPTKTIVYAPDGDKLALMEGTANVWSWIRMPANGVAVYHDGSLDYFRHADWEGSSRLATNTSNGLYFDGEYSPYGVGYGESGPTDEQYAQLGHELDPELYDSASRFYDPGAGRWLSPDPIGLAAADPSSPQSFNRYAYAGNMPGWNVDPSGHCPGCINPLLIHMTVLACGPICIAAVAVGEGLCTIFCPDLFGPPSPPQVSPHAHPHNLNNGKPDCSTQLLKKVDGHYFSPKVAGMVKSAMSRMKAVGLNPLITSGYRFPGAAVLDPVFTPAKYSMHALGDAVDIESCPRAPFGASSMARGIMDKAGFRDGLTFGDPVHFDFNTLSARFHSKLWYKQWAEQARKVANYAKNCLHLG